ncbi:unnamed protein product [Urochloa decumbens]|uniref:DUF7595 domain-containing protein n=1 Tax=Urochloa decumbens TaxID=240449 RepID=A0ABC8XIF9_9POAL
MEVAPPPMESLPIDLQLEIVAHSDDAATILRCATTCKPLRAAVHGPGFRPRSQAALLAAAHAGFDPSLLLGISSSYPLSDRAAAADHHQSRLPHLDGDLLRPPPFEPVSSRDGLLVLWRRDPEPELRVCNTSTGAVTTLPCIDVEGKWGSGGIYRPALINLGRGCRRNSFELLVMDVCFRTRIFSSRDASWGAIRIVKPPPEHDSWCAVDEAMRTSPAVVRGTVHWVCRSTRGTAASGGVFVLALQVGAAQATAIEPPQGCGVGSTASCVSLTDAADRLGMVVSGAEAISTWKLSTKGWWSQEAVISKHVIAPGMDASRTVCWCVGFRKKSGAVLLWMERVGLVQINMGTKAATVLRRCSHPSAATPVRLRDIDLASLF